MANLLGLFDLCDAVDRKELLKLQRVVARDDAVNGKCGGGKVVAVVGGGNIDLDKFSELTAI